MCGICGFAGPRADLNDDDLIRMNDTIRRRGPDEGGHWLGDEAGLAMRRLSILDLEGSHQPMSNADGTVTLVYNGEIYNFRELREALLARGHRFKTHGDTEVLVYLYEEYGVDMVDHLRGMFAFALWDQRERRLLIARDRLGIKPLFYAFHEGTLYFASEMKALLAANRLPRDLDLQAIDQYLTYTYIPAPRSIFASISKLRPGHRLVLQGGQLREERYWDADFSKQDHQASEGEWRERIEAKLYDAVQSHLVSDVPLGAFLSGGIDSSLVVAMMSQSTKQPVQSFTMGFGGDDLALRDERPYARMLGERYDIEFNDFTVQPDFREIMDEIVESFDEPFADDSVIPSYYISKLTRQKVKVALSGLGGDELFGGYHRYRGFLMSSYYDYMPRFLRAGVADPIIQSLPEPRGGDDRVDHWKRFSRFSTLPPAERYLGYVSSLDIPARERLYADGLRSSIDFGLTSSVITEPFGRCQSEDLLDRVFYTDLNTYLPDDILALSDRSSMWHSLELRVPLIDHELTELTATMPSRYKVRLGSTKYLLRGIAEKWLPSEIIHHRKQGFESPMAAWMRGELREFAGDILADPILAEMGWFQPAEIQSLWEDHLGGRKKNNKILFSLLMLAGWMRKYLN